MKLTRLIPALAAFAVYADAATLEVINYPEEPDPLKDHPLTEKVQALSKLNLEKRAEEARRLSPSERKELVSHIKKMSDRYGGVMHDGAYSSQLTILYLGDEEMRRHLAQKFAESPNPRGLGPSGDPELVPLLAPYLFREEPAWDTAHGDVSAPRLSISACDTIAKIVGNSPAFTGEVGDWARRVQQPFGTPEYREILREWWRANEAAFKAKDFKAVRLGRLGPHSDVITKPDWATRLDTAPPIPPAAAVAPAPATKTPAAVAPAVARFDPTLWVFGSLTLLVAIACGWIFWRRKV
ncbi:MAG: hypothetical protein M3436_20950 [Pseudomonadota bacterium]|nr:hypothetical protein [Pseudomonadota bacterium]